MGNQNCKLNFEDMQRAITENYIIINTMPKDLQHCLIQNTMSAHEEELKINQLINNCKNTHIIMVGTWNVCMYLSMYTSMYVCTIWKHMGNININVINVCVHVCIEFMEVCT